MQHKDVGEQTTESLLSYNEVTRFFYLVSLVSVMIDLQGRLVHVTSTRKQSTHVTSKK